MLQHTTSYSNYNCFTTSAWSRGESKEFKPLKTVIWREAIYFYQNRMGKDSLDH